jgi:hypothetical protein
MVTTITINLEEIISTQAKLNELDNYLRMVLELAGEGNDVIITGRAPVWLYLKVSHALHGKVRKLIYDSPVTGEIIIYDHNPS